jgi:LPXTG-site transpeptidase (sortase) family protein
MTRRAAAVPGRWLGALLCGAVLTASLAGCSLDTAAFRSRLAAAEVTLPAASVPTSLEIPAIGVRRETVGVGIEDDDTLEVPSSGEDVGWYSPDGTPDGGHPTVFVAHVDTPAGPAVFGRLAELEPGDAVEVTTAAGEVHAYRVDRVADHRVDDFPTLEVYGSVAGDEIRLLTCTGEFDGLRQRYEENRVVFASRAN